MKQEKTFWLALCNVTPNQQSQDWEVGRERVGRTRMLSERSGEVMLGTRLVYDVWLDGCMPQAFGQTDVVRSLQKQSKAPRTSPKTTEVLC